MEDDDNRTQLSVDERGMGIPLGLVMTETKPTGEMSEKNLVKVASILRPDNKWDSQQRFYYDKSNKRRYYQVDCISYDGKIVIEYEGPSHYIDVWKSLRDDARKKFFIAAGYTFFRWPYYLQLTRSVAEHYFGPIDEKLYSDAIRSTYGVASEGSILACGFHTTKNTPSNFTYLGVERFLRELNELPEIVGKQVSESLRRYSRDVGDSNLVLGTDERVHALISKVDTSKHVSGFYERKHSTTKESIE